MEDTIKTDLRKMGCQGVVWNHVAQDMQKWWVLVTAVMEPEVLQNVGNSLMSWRTVSFLGMTPFRGVRELIYLYNIEPLYLWHFMIILTITIIYVLILCISVRYSVLWLILYPTGLGCCNGLMELNKMKNEFQQGICKKMLFSFRFKVTLT